MFVRFFFTSNFLFVMGLIIVAMEEMIGFIYMIVVKELEIISGIDKNKIKFLLSKAETIVFSFGMNPINGGIPISDSIEIIIELE